MCTIMDITLSEYLANLKNSGGSHRALLFGNGLGLSHPDDAVRRAFHFDGLRTSIDIKQYLHEWIAQDEPSPIEDLKNPETFLHVLRLKILGEVLDGYMKKINATGKPNKYKVHSFLDNFTNIFTLNYDSLSYRIFSYFFEPNKVHKNSKIFIDGFNGLTPTKIKAIKNSLGIKNKEKSSDYKNRFFFVHGAFHIMLKKNDNSYYKLSINDAESSSTLSNKIEELINILTLPQFSNDKEKFIERPLLIFEDRSDVKKILIEKDDYLKMCYEELEKTSGHVFVFGCSFERDAHILEALFHPPHKDLYIAYLEGDNHTKDNVKAFLKKNSPKQSPCVSIFWVKVELSEKHLPWTHLKTF